jgi:hypothetical protein
MTNEEFITSISLPEEEWRDVVGYEGLYAISSLGRVACLKTGTHQRVLMKPIYMTVRKQTYNNLCLYVNGKRKHHLVHRLVAEAFIPNPKHYPCIDHIDGCGTNNCASNLRWCTRSMNNNNPISIMRQSESHRNKIMPTIRKKVVQLKDGMVVKTYDSVSDVEKDGFTHSCVSRVCQNKLYSHKGYKWMYLSDYESLVSMSKNSKSTLD